MYSSSAYYEAGLASTLAGLGLCLPEEDSQAALDDLAAAYFDAFVSPRGGHPPIQSLAEGSGYEGEPARAHLAWALPMLRSREADTGFYGRLCGVTAAFIDVVLESRPG